MEVIVCQMTSSASLDAFAVFTCGKLRYTHIIASFYVLIWSKKDALGKKDVGMCACLAMSVILDWDASTKTTHRCACLHVCKHSSGSMTNALEG